jgi:hypothetical protein
LIKPPNTNQRTLRATFDVPTSELRKAFKSVLPHASKIRFDHVLGRVQLRFTAAEVVVVASDRATVGLAYVSIEDHRDGDQAGEFDLSHEQTKEILGLFKAKPVKEQHEGSEVIRFTVAVDTVTVTDAGGLFPGKSYTMPRIPAAAGYPHLPELVAHGLTRPRTDAAIITLSGEPLARFKAAAAAYSTDLQVEPTGDHTALIVACGDKFVGLVMPHKLDDQEAALVREWRAEWQRLLPTPDADLLFTVDVPLPAQGDDDVVDAEIVEDDGHEIKAATGGTITSMFSEGGQL